MADVQLLPPAGRFLLFLLFLCSFCSFYSFCSLIAARECASNPHPLFTRCHFFAPCSCVCTAGILPSPMPHHARARHCWGFAHLTLAVRAPPTRPQRIILTGATAICSRSGTSPRARSCSATTGILPWHMAGNGSGFSVAISRHLGISASRHSHAATTTIAELHDSDPPTLATTAPPPNTTRTLCRGLVHVTRSARLCRQINAALSSCYTEQVPMCFASALQFLGASRQKCKSVVATSRPSFHYYCTI